VELIYINSGVSSVFPSQVIDLLNFYHTNNWFTKITLICGVRNELERKKAEELLSSSSLDVIFYKSFPNYPFYNIIAKIYLAKAINKAQINKSTLFHSRGWNSANLVYKSLQKVGLGNPKILLDIRGAIKEEVLDFQKTNWFRKMMKSINVYKVISAVKNYAFISVVSSALKDYVLSNVGNIKGEVFINPCLAGKSFIYSVKQREKLRSALGIKENEKLLVFSSGGESLWQNNQELIKIANKGFKVLNLSKVNVDHPNVITKFVKYEEVAGYMSTADVALIFREKNVVNKVASPVKFSEYLCSGLPVISNKNVDVIEQCIENTGYGLLIDSMDNITLEAIDKLCTISRNKISEYGRLLFGIESVAERYLKIYNEMIKQE
jgi:glycosyltransferase involved in cell wall biosynthesis